MRSKLVYFQVENDIQIINYMKIYGDLPNRFPIISGLMLGKFTNNQISERWRNYLNPELCKEDLGFYEKVIIDYEVQKILVSSDTIRWRNIIRELYRLFGKLYSENKVKNYWNSKHRRRATKYIKGDAKKENELKTELWSPKYPKYSKDKKNKAYKVER